MKQCKTCKHWTAVDKNEWNEICNPYDPDTFESMEMPFEVRRCEHPKLLFCERPVEINGFATMDGSEYKADLYTAEEYGCVLHEEGEINENQG
jgi:hypothetical protein